MASEGAQARAQPSAPLIGLLENANKQAQLIRREIAAMKPEQVGGVRAATRLAAAAPPHAGPRA
jgi:hypothetical protein